MDRFHRLLPITIIILVLLASAFSVCSYYFSEPKELVTYYYSPMDFNPNQRVVCVFFDDGWKSQMSAIPVLETYGFRATFAIMTSYQSYPAYLNWSEIQSLSDYGQDIECHSYSHVDLTNLIESDLIQEIVESKAILREHGFDSELFVYPFGLGWGNETVRDMVSENYLAARCVIQGIYDIQKGDRYAITDFEISNTTTLNEFKSYVDGSRGNIISIIDYHRIGDGSVSTMVTLSQFEGQMAYLNSSGCTVMTLRDVLFKENAYSIFSPTPSPIATPSPSSQPRPADYIIPVIIGVIAVIMIGVAILLRRK